MESREDFKSYASEAAYRAAFSESLMSAPAIARAAAAPPLYIDWLATPLGPMLCVASAQHLYMLEFTTRKAMDKGFARLRKNYRCAIVPGRTAITQQIEAELMAYFKGELCSFKTPLALTGTAFQKQVWGALCKIPYGQRCAYSDLAARLGNERAVRAAASANARNILALIIPCHRVIAKDGSLGGYAGGLERKSWLLTHEAARR